MKKIGLIIPNNIEKSPYVQYYIDIFEKNDVNYEIIEWCREKSNSKNIIYYSKIHLDNKLIKLYLYLNFIKFCKKEISCKKYDKLIIFTAQLGIFLMNFLNKYYKNKYIVDIRDYNVLIKYRKNLFYKLLKNSCYNIISSNGFKKWLPKEFNYITCHNISYNLLCFKNEKKLIKNDCKKILTIGMIRDLKQQEKFLNYFHDKYILEYRGIGKNIEFLKKKYDKLENIKFYGKYKKEEELEFYLNSDFINLVVGKDINSKTLIANRFYNALITNKYMIASKDSYMGELVKKYQLGVLFEEINCFDIEISKLNFNKEILVQSIKKEQQEFEKNLKLFINSNMN